MSFEYDPKHSARKFSYLENLAEAAYPHILHTMDWYVASPLITSSENFGPVLAERIDIAGQELAHRLIGIDTTEQDIADMRKCVRFGLTLVRELTGVTQYASGLDTIEELFRKKADIENIVGGSYDRYLRLYPRLAETLFGNLKPMAHEPCQQPGQNVISFLLEEAEPKTDTYIEIQLSDFEQEIRTILDHPPDPPTA